MDRSRDTSASGVPKVDQPGVLVHFDGDLS